jgi:hypothetical protein
MSAVRWIPTPLGDEDPGAPVKVTWAGESTVRDLDFVRKELERAREELERQCSSSSCSSPYGRSTTNAGRGPDELAPR